MNSEETTATGKLQLKVAVAKALTMFVILLGMPAGADSQVESAWQRKDRHDELRRESSRWDPADPGLTGLFPVPLLARDGEEFKIELENKVDGQIRVLDGRGQVSMLGKVLSPVRRVNAAGFTASGWAAPGTVCASSVNALHIKTNHDYTTGKSTLFSVLPVEFAEFDPKEYKSYYSASASLVTDISAGSSIFGGVWAPSVGSKVNLQRGGEGEESLPVDYKPEVGDLIVITVKRHKYNPEWIEFENRFGGIIWVKEIALDPYPVGQVLKPVAGAGRFSGSLYVGRGRLRANHPGVICISTSDIGEVGGFQIIPRDHAMSSEMTAARTKTQWMVVGPLWAFDPSWEGLPPLFSDYLYPAYLPLSGKLADGTEVSGAEVFLQRCTVRARYSDAADPSAYELLRETAPLSFECLKNMTHLRIYLPRE